MNETLAYLAGLWDGEGCFTISYVKAKAHRVSPYWGAVASICMTNRIPLDILSETFGGVPHLRLRAGVEYKDIYEWKLWSLKAKNFAELLLPWLRIKDRQAKVLIDFQNHINTQGTLYTHGETFKGCVLTKEDIITRTAFRAEIQRLNKRGKV
jgi:hypothetical protein